MIALFIIFGILLLIFLVLMIRVRVFLTYDDSVELSVKFLFVKLVIISKYKEKKPKEEKKEKKKKPEEKKEEKEDTEEKTEKESFLTRLKNKHGLPGLLSLFTDLLKIATGAVSGILRHVIFSKFDLDLVICSSDSAATALNYGRACSVIYPAVTALSRLTPFKDFNIFVAPKFDGEKNIIYFDTEFYLRPVFALHYALIAVFKLLFIYIREKFSKG